MFLRRRAELVDIKPLRDMVATQRAIRADHVRQSAILVTGHGLEQGFADFHGLLVCGFFRAKGARMARATLVGMDAGAWDQLEHLFRFLADVLHPATKSNSLGKEPHRLTQRQPWQMSNMRSSS